MMVGASAQDVFPPPAQAERYFATRTDQPVRVDARLDEPIWQQAELISEFIQKDPNQGEPGSYATEVRVAFDDEALYIAAVNFQPRASTRVQNLQRDFSYQENDLFGVAIDGFMDARNAVVFQVTPFGSQRDMEVIDGSGINADWDSRWSVQTRIEADRWFAEIAIPWRNLRYPPGADRLGVIFARNIRSLNQSTSAPPVPRAYTVYRMAYAAELVGLDVPVPGTNLQFNPYALVDRLSQTGERGETRYEAGGELKWALSQRTILDLTLNTDFAQVDADRQALNFERFSVFFPERRQFFLENANVFDASVTNWIRPFFSRRIGLDSAGNPLSIDGGLRLTQRTSKHELGLLAMHQPEQLGNPASGFGVARYSRNLAGQSRLGGMLTWRNDDALRDAATSIDPNQNITVTIDGLWRPNQTFGIQAMASTSHDDLAGDGLGTQVWAFYENNFVYVGLLEYFNRDYTPGIGLEILNTNFVMHGPAISFDWRPDWLPDGIRSLSPGVSAFIFEDSDDGDLLFGYAPIRPLRLYFDDGARLSVFVEPNWQRLEQAFFPVGIEIAADDYDYTRYRLDYESDQSAAIAGSISVETGDYFDGELTSYSVSGRYAPNPYIELSADYELNRIRNLGVASEDDDTRLIGINLRIALNPQLQFTTFYQHNSASDRSSLNARLAWEYRPLSYLYLVYNRNEFDGFGTTPQQTGEQIIAKLTYLFEL